MLMLRFNLFSIASNSLSYIIPYQNTHTQKNKNSKSSIKYWIYTLTFTMMGIFAIALVTFPCSWLSSFHCKVTWSLALYVVPRSRHYETKLEQGQLNPSPVHVDQHREALCNISQHCWMWHVASVCTSCCMMLLHIVGSCCTKFETG